MEDVFVCVWDPKGRQSLPMFTLTPALHYRDRYEGQLNEFLLENKNLKEQLTTLQVVWLANKSRLSNFNLKSNLNNSQDVEGQLAGAKEEVRGAHYYHIRICYYHYHYIIITNIIKGPRSPRSERGAQLPAGLHTSQGGKPWGRGVQVEHHQRQYFLFFVFSISLFLAVLRTYAKLEVSWIHFWIQKNFSPLTCGTFSIASSRLSMEIWWNRATNKCNDFVILAPKTQKSNKQI